MKPPIAIAKMRMVSLGKGYKMITLVNERLLEKDVTEITQLEAERLSVETELEALRKSCHEDILMVEAYLADRSEVLSTGRVDIDAETVQSRYNGDIKRCEKRLAAIDRDLVKLRRSAEFTSRTLARFIP